MHKLIAIYNVWGDSLELLQGSIEQIREHVDCVCVVAQEMSNGGEIDKNVYPYLHYLQGKGLIDQIIYYSPKPGNRLDNEKTKRQLGIEHAIEKGYTHFIHLDCDEYYHGDEFKKHYVIISATNPPGGINSKPPIFPFGSYL